jgi:hypothetical protein
MIKELLDPFLPQDIVYLIIWEYSGIVPTHEKMTNLYNNVLLQLRKSFVLNELRKLFTT